MWIESEKRTPEEDKTTGYSKLVLGYTKDHHYLIVRKCSYGWVIHDRQTIINDGIITHWSSLPKKPNNKIASLLNFEKFWDLYPKKVSKKPAITAFCKLSETDQQKAINALSVHLRYWQLKEVDKEFIPHPATWLNQSKFDDELDLQPKKVKKPEITWFSTDDMTMAKGREIKVNPFPGESMQEYRQRIAYKLRANA